MFTHQFTLVRLLNSEIDGGLKFLPTKSYVLSFPFSSPHCRYYGILNGIAPSHYCTFSSIEPNIPNLPYVSPCPSPSQVRSLSKYIVACDKFVLSSVTSGDGTPNLVAGVLDVAWVRNTEPSRRSITLKPNPLPEQIPNAPMRHHILKYYPVMYHLNAFEQWT
jgi:hypothetical protein